jgi:hypothetical protein
MLQLVEFNFMPANNSRKQLEQFTIIVNSINQLPHTIEGGACKSSS